MDMIADDLMQRPGPEPVVRDGCVEWLKDLLKHKPMAASEVKEQAKEAGISQATLRRAKEKLGIVPYKQNFSSPWMWELPKVLTHSPDLKG